MVDTSSSGARRIPAAVRSVLERWQVQEPCSPKLTEFVSRCLTLRLSLPVTCPVPFRAQDDEIISLASMCLDRCKSKQEQLDNLVNLPPSEESCRAIFDDVAGYLWADIRLLYYGDIDSDATPGSASIYSYARLQVEVYRKVISGRCRGLSIKDCEKFFEQLLPCNIKSPTGVPILSDGEKRMLTAYLLNHNGAGSVCAFAEWGVRTKQCLGARAFLSLFGSPTSSIEQTTATAQVAMELFQLESVVTRQDDCSSATYDTARELLDQLRAGTCQLSAFQVACKEMLTKIYHVLYPEKPLQSVLDGLKGCTQEIDVVLPHDTVDLIGRVYTDILTIAQRLGSASEEDILSEVYTAAGSLREKVPPPVSGRTSLCARDYLSHNETATIFAALREIMRKRYKITPYNTQICTALAMLQAQKDTRIRGRLAQVRTGEGKSTIVALLASFLALVGRHVDVVSSSEPLSIRDQAKYKPFFSQLGLTSSHVCGERPEKGAFAQRITYGTNTNYEFAILFEGLYQHGVYKLADGSDRPQDVVIVDEVDNLLIDRGSTPAIISVPGRDPLMWIVQVTWDFYNDNVKKSNPELLLAILMPGVASGLEIFTTYRQLIFAHAKTIGCDMTSVSDENLAVWLQSCHRATQLLENVDYVVRTRQGHPEDNGERKIIIVDKSTGELQEGSQWGDRLHQFVQQKHDLRLEGESARAAELAHPAFFGEYVTLYGLTGTIGSAAERDEVQIGYKVDTFDVPPHRPSLRTVLPPAILCNQRDQFVEILRNIESMQNANRPTLVLFPTIEISKAFSVFLSEAQIAHGILNAVQNEDPDFIIARAGRARAVTVATNTAGRGTDIILSATSLKAGGLHVVLGFYAENDRVEAQGVGRAARQGQPGSCCTVLAYSTLEVWQQNAVGRTHLEPGQDWISRLATAREHHIIALSKTRLEESVLSHVNNALMRRFFSSMKQWRETAGDHSIRHHLLQQLGRAADSPQAAGDTGRHAHRDVGSSELQSAIRSLADCFNTAAHVTGQDRTAVFTSWLNLFLKTLSQMELAEWAMFFTSLPLDQSRHRRNHPLFGDLNEDVLALWQDQYRRLAEESFQERTRAVRSIHFDPKRVIADDLDLVIKAALVLVSNQPRPRPDSIVWGF